MVLDYFFILKGFMNLNPYPMNNVVLRMEFLPCHCDLLIKAPYIFQGGKGLVVKFVNQVSLYYSGREGTTC